MLNKIRLIGNLGRDPEISLTSSGQAVTRFSVTPTQGRKRHSHVHAAVSFLHEAGWGR